MLVVVMRAIAVHDLPRGLADLEPSHRHRGGGLHERLVRTVELQQDVGHRRAATGVGDCSARAGAVPVAGTEAKASTSAANNAVFIRRGFTFIFHETAVQPTGQLNGRKRPK